MPELFDIQVSEGQDNAASIARHVMDRANARIQSRVRTVTCPVHRQTFAVSVRGLEIGVFAKVCCRAGIDQALEQAVEEALRARRS